MGTTVLSLNGATMRKKRLKNQTWKKRTKAHKVDLLKKQTVKRWKTGFQMPSFTIPALFSSRIRMVLLMLILFLSLGTGIFLSVTQKPDIISDGIELPERKELIEGQLLKYSSVSLDAQGSGDINLNELPIVRSVRTSAYEVKSGDTLSEIAANHSIDVGTLISFNKINDVRRLMAGSSIMIPDLDGIPYTVKSGDSLERIASEYGISLESILDANDLQTAVIRPGQKLFIPGASISEYDFRKAMGTLFIYPVYGRLTSGYGYRNDPFTGVKRMHYGVDLAGRLGNSVKASMEGTVAAIGNQPNGYGKYVVLKHRQGYQTLYGHLSAISVRMNQTVAQGQKIGELGNTGRSTGPHLHFSLYKNNVPINPLGGYLYQ